MNIQFGNNIWCLEPYFLIAFHTAKNVATRCKNFLQKFNEILQIGQRHVYRNSSTAECAVPSGSIGVKLAELKLPGVRGTSQLGWEHPL